MWERDWLAFGSSTAVYQFQMVGQPAIKRDFTPQCVYAITTHAGRIFDMVNQGGKMFIQDDTTILAVGGTATHNSRISCDVTNV
jgi:hypothetical protein